MLTERQTLIMKVIVEEYVKTAEPVGSRTLSKLDKLKCSPATIRNEMVDLEEYGFLEKTHTSSGRIPSEEGYRYYVHNLMDFKNEEKKTYEVIDEILAKNIRKEELISESIKLISQMTNYTSFATGINKDSVIKKMELVKISEKESLVLIVTDDGNVKNEKITIPEGVSFEEMDEVIETIAKIVFDEKISDVSKKLKEEIDAQKIREYIDYQEKVMKVFVDAFSKFVEDNKYYQSGQTNILKLPEFSDIKKVRELMETIENKEVFKTLSKEKELSVQIGSEVTLDSMTNDDMAVISVPYQIGNEIGKIAVMGPKRMDYEKVIPLLKYISEGLNKK